MNELISVSEEYGLSVTMKNSGYMDSWTLIQLNIKDN